MKDYFKIITDNGLTIRQIPKEVKSTFSMRNHKKGQKIVYETLDNHINYIPFKKKHEHREDLIFDDETETIKRAYTQKITIPSDAGYWMCKQVKNTDSIIRWNKKTDNLAPTLEESINKFLTNN